MSSGHFLTFSYPGARSSITNRESGIDLIKILKNENTGTR